ncbi:MAG TPA: ChaN family lipoprotein [Kofleriaceae bacterium]|nr:ChaN family lipoprotein [Kofleriaceae bacterium]
MVFRAVWIALAVAACAGTYGGHPPTTPGAAGPRGVEAAGLPYHVLDRAGHQLDEATFWSRLGAARVACIGEEHPNPHHHWVQLEVVRHLVKVWPHVALGMEMFQRPFQGVLDDFAAKKISEDDLRSRSGWADRWGYDFGLYRPTIAAVVDAHGALIALNAPKELTHKVAHHGLESLSPDERAQVPELDLKVAAHRAWFDALMEEMGGSDAHAKKDDKAAKDDKPDKPDKQQPPSDPPPAEAMPTADNIYTVQVMWDETMADTAAKFLAAHPDAHLVILAGNGHCHDSAIVDRMKRRGVKDVVSVRPVIDDGEDGVAQVLAKPMHDFVVVLELPADVKAKMAAEREREK